MGANDKVFSGSGENRILRNLVFGLLQTDNVLKVQQKEGRGKQLGATEQQQPTEYQTITRKDSNRTVREFKAMMGEEGDFLRPLVHTVIQEFLEAEMAEAISAEKRERVEGRLSYRSGYYRRSFITRVGKLEPGTSDQGVSSGQGDRHAQGLRWIVRIGARAAVVRTDQRPSLLYRRKEPGDKKAA